MPYIGNNNATYATKRLWDRYIQYLMDKDVKLTAARWYVIRAEHYIKTFSEMRLVDHGPAEVDIYLKMQRRNTQIEDWQFRQVIDAIHKMFEMLDVAWLDQVDWKHWIRSSSLSKPHPAISHEAQLEETIL